MEILYKNQNGDLKISLCGELDHHNANAIREALDRLILEQNFKKLIFNFEKLTFMDSTGIGVLLGRYKKLKERAISVYVENAVGSIDKLLKLSGIYNIFIKL